MNAKTDDPETYNPGALCCNCRYCHIPQIDGFFAYENRIEKGKHHDQPKRTEIDRQAQKRQPEQ